MRTSRISAVAVTAFALAVGLALTGCSGSGGEEGDFCAAFDAAGGSFATTSNFQAGLPAGEIIDDLTSRIEVMEAAPAPDEIAAEWETIRDLYTEVITIAERVPADEPLLEPRTFDIVSELTETSSTVRDYLDATC